MLCKLYIKMHRLSVGSVLTYPVHLGSEMNVGDKRRNVTTGDGVLLRSESNGAEGGNESRVKIARVSWYVELYVSHCS